MWFIASIVGSVLLVILNTLSKLNPINYFNSIPMCVISITTTFCFWYSWQTSPKSFLSVWFLNSGIVTAGAFIANAYVGEQIAIKDLVYVLLVLGGIVGLRWG